MKTLFKHPPKQHAFRGLFFVCGMACLIATLHPFIVVFYDQKNPLIIPLLQKIL